MPASHIDSYRLKESRLVAGVMSGTSLDAVDVALVRLAGTGAALRHSVAGLLAVPISADLRRRLLAASVGDMGLRETFELDADLGELYADAVMELLTQAGMAPGELDAIGLHGQTVYHAPRRSPNGLSVQIGSAAVVAERLRSIVVNDFRAADVAAGGEGAPLVPYCDFVLLHDASLNRVALNIGGIANITWLPGDAHPDTLIAFDTGPGNMLVDAAMRMMFNRDYDANGDVAASGLVNTAWLAELLADEYFAAPPPKSAGRERFGEERGRTLVADARAAGLAEADIVATLTMLTARTIADAVGRFAAKGLPVHEVIVGGGGARNATMMAMLHGAMQAYGEDVSVVASDAVGIPSDAKEAICFAILANEAILETPAGLRSVTGAARNVICGAIRLP